MFSWLSILSVLYLWFPLLLSIKCLNTPSDHAYNEQSRFLLHYWLWYLLIVHVQWLYSSFLLPGSLLLEACCACVKIWLLYGHGCLIMSHFYIPGAVALLCGSSDITTIEKSMVDPLMSSFVIKNPILHAVVSVLLRSNTISFASGVFDFYFELRRTSSWNKFPGTLTLGLHCLCFLDDPSQLTRRYNLLHLYLSSFSPKSRLSPSSTHSPRTRSPRNMPPRSDTLSPRSPTVMSKRRKARYTELLGQELLTDPSQPRSVSDNSMDRKRAPRSRSVSSGEPPYPLHAEVPLP